MKATIKILDLEKNYLSELTQKDMLQAIHGGGFFNWLGKKVAEGVDWVEEKTGVDIPYL